MTHGKPHGWHVTTTPTTAALRLRRELIHEATGTTTARAVHALERHWRTLPINERWHRGHWPIYLARTHGES